MGIVITTIKNACFPDRDARRGDDPSMRGTSSAFTTDSNAAAGDGADDAPSPPRSITSPPASPPFGAGGGGARDGDNAMVIAHGGTSDRDASPSSPSLATVGSAADRAAGAEIERLSARAALLNPLISSKKTTTAEAEEDKEEEEAMSTTVTSRAAEAGESAVDSLAKTTKGKEK